MHGRNFFLASLCLVSTLFCFSQTKDTVEIEKMSCNLKISYNSSLIYPGARLGIEFPYKIANVIKQKNHGKEKNFVSSQFISGNISWYHHPDFHDNLYFTAGWTTRRTKSAGFMTEFSPEIGLSRTFLGATTYKVDEIGNVIIEKHAGYYYAFGSLGGGFGYDFSRTMQKPFIAFYKLNIMAMFPYNSTIYIRPAMEMGIIYKPASFIPVKFKSKKK